MRQFSLDMSNPVRPSVLVDGVPVGVPLHRVILDWSEGNVPRLVLEVESPSGLDGEGVVHEHTPSLDNDQLVSWLKKLDPQMLDEKVLESLGIGDAVTGQKYLEVLQRWARGEV